MAAGLEALSRPADSVDVGRPSRHRTIGFTIGVVGLIAAIVAAIGNFVAAGDLGDGTTTRETLAWTAGLNIAGFGTVKLGIAIILIGVLIRARARVESAKAALPLLKADAPAGTPPTYGDIDTPSGKAFTSATAPGPLPINRIAPKLWRPMLVMGVMGLTAGLVLALVRAGTSDSADFGTLGAWSAGLMFLAEAMMLAAISLLLGSILGALRAGGGELQESLGITVKTLKMPLSATAFIAVMMAGMMVAIGQFVLSIIVAYVDEPAAWNAWLGTLRELSLGVLLLAIVLALYTIGTVLRFQFNRMREIVTTGG